MKKRILLLFVGALVIAGCSSRGTFLDDFLVLGGSSMAQIDEYFDLNNQQHEQLEKNIDSDLNRLRKERFQKIAKTLRDIERSAKRPDNQKVMSTAFVDLQSHYQQASPYFKGSTEKLIASLKEAQIKNFQKKVEKEIADTKAGLKNPATLNEEIIGRYKRGLEFWVGDLSTAQQRSIAQFTRDHPYPWNEKIRNKESILKQFMAVHEDPVQIRKFAERFISDYAEMRTPEYAAAMKGYEKEFQAFLDSFWSSLSAEQKSRIHEYLVGRAEKLELLAKRP